MKTLAEILQIEGITVRRVPFETTSTFNYCEGQALKEGQTVFTYEHKHGSRQMVREVKPNSLGGKYIIRITNGQGSIVHFDIKQDGVGDTIESAYADLIAKDLLK